MRLIRSQQQEATLLNSGSKVHLILKLFYCKNNMRLFLSQRQEVGTFYCAYLNSITHIFSFADELYKNKLLFHEYFLNNRN